MTWSLADVSLVVPTRNEAHNIAAFLDSIHPDVTLIVVDASTDGTDRLIETLRPNRTVVVRAAVGITEARQIGADAATTPWLLFSDADVRFATDYFDGLPRLLAGDAFYGPKYATSSHSQYSLVFNTGQRLLHAFKIPAASGSNMGVLQAVFRQVGGFRRDLTVNEDTELVLRIWRQGYRVCFLRDLGVASLDDRRLKHGSVRKLLHSVSRSALLLVNQYVPLPRRWLRHDWGYWRSSHANRGDLRDISTGH